jgi:hypothetical protein
LSEDIGFHGRRRDYFHFGPKTLASMAAGATLSTFARGFQFPLPQLR